MLSPFPVRIEPIELGSSRLKEFTRLPWRLYRGDPCWTPPLNAELLGSHVLGLPGLLRRQHPYHSYAEVTHFLAWRGNEPVGRISAAVNRRFNEHYKTTIGFFGFFEVVNDYDVAVTLLDAARDWVKARGMAVLRGPGEYSNATHERQGLLVEGFEHTPTFDTTHNPPYYADFFERYGLRKTMDYHAYIMDLHNGSLPRLQELARLVKRRRRFETRPMEMKRLREEVGLIVDIYNEAWSANWGFLPILESEADLIADGLKMVADPECVRFAIVDGKPIAVLGTLPDPNFSLRPRWRWFGDSDPVRILRMFVNRRRIPRLRAFFLGIRPQYRNWGIDGVLGAEVLGHAASIHYRTAEASLMLEDNDKIIGAFEFMGGKRYKTWRIYDLPL